MQDEILENREFLDIILAGYSSQARQLKIQVERAGNASNPALIFGEPGAGKFSVARLIHENLNRGGKFIPFLVSEQGEGVLSRLLKRHTTTSPNAKAAQNTLYFDDIADFSLGAQRRLAAFLKSFERGGGFNLANMPKIITATSQDLNSLVKYNAFSRDLYWLLNVLTVSIPNLQHRKGDIPLIIKRFMKQEYAPRRPPELSEKAMNALVRYGWPGNIREMKNVVTRLKALGRRNRITLRSVAIVLANPLTTETGMGRGQNLSSAIYRNLEKYFKAHEKSLPPEGLYDRILREVERPLISLTLNATKGNQIKAARLLGLNRNTLRKKLKNLDIDAKDMKS
jgi:two-component system nitrogen regulation response regulator GlnG